MESFADNELHRYDEDWFADETEAPTTRLTSRIVPPGTPRSPETQRQDGGRGRPRPEKAIVTLSAEDESGGSGVATTYYALPDDTEPRRYEGPFEAPLGTVVRFASVDGAGNVELAKKVLVDDAPSTLRAAEPFADGDDLARYIEFEGDEDWFSFEADGVSLYRLHLHGLHADYDLALYDSDGDEIVTSSERGKRSEGGKEGLSPGRYYVKVSGFEGAFDADKPYALDLGALDSGGAPGNGRP